MRRSRRHGAMNGLYVRINACGANGCVCVCECRISIKTWPHDSHFLMRLRVKWSSATNEKCIWAWAIYRPSYPIYEMITVIGFGDSRCVLCIDGWAGKLPLVVRCKFIGGWPLNPTTSSAAQSHTYIHIDTCVFTFVLEANLTGLRST